MTSNTPVNRYGALAAEVYDIDKPVGSLSDITFLIDRLTQVSGPILEPACGSGRALIPLMEAGCDMTGFDASAEMLAQCQARCAARNLHPELSQQRFLEFAYDRPFAAIVVPVGTFGLIDTFDDATTVMRRFHGRLAPGGLLILDVQPVRALTASGERRRAWTAANGDLITCDTRRVAVNWLGQRFEYHAVYQRWRENVLIETQLEPMALRYWGLQEMILALGAAGFGEIKVFGDYDRSRPPRAGDGSLTFEALKSLN
jgi:SAM-dependent methyltransferase